MSPSPHDIPTASLCTVLQLWFTVNYNQRPYVTGCFYFFSCTVNPVLYNVMSAKYRLAFRKTLCCGNTERSTSTEASTFKDTTVVYVNSHFDHCRCGLHVVFVLSGGSYFIKQLKCSRTLISQNNWGFQLSR